MARLARIFALILVFFVSQSKTGVVSPDWQLPTRESLKAGAERAVLLLDKSIESLEEIKSWAIKHHKDSNIVQTVGTSVGTIGTIGVVVGVLFSFFTGGASLILTKISLGASIGGGITSLGVGINDIVKTKSYNERAAKILEETNQQIKKFEKDMSDAISYIESTKEFIKNKYGLEDDAASRIISEITKHGSSIPMSVLRATGSTEAVEMFSAVNIVREGILPAKTAQTVRQSLSAAERQIMSEFLSTPMFFNEHAKLFKRNIAKLYKVAAFNFVLMGVSVGLNVWEIISLVNSWNSTHPSAIAVDVAIRNLQNIRNNAYHRIVKQL
ncbi:uncharacterized protein LOC132087876 [Daphnia carinata]|uniref:uncharacterized protein LOC132087876 n=1 Tax=Daphnia carinata TaxID=120202 RepID=UPI002868FBBE|nr:uncharacterized protein LOC132087876 [Daphnia carinata]